MLTGERADDTVLPGIRDHLAPLTRLHLRVDPGHFLRIGSNGGFDEQALEGMIEVPVIDDVLVVPDDLSGVGVDCGVVVEYVKLLPASVNLGAGMVTEVPTKMRLSSGSLGTIQVPTCQPWPWARRPRSRSLVLPAAESSAFSRLPSRWRRHAR